MRRVIALTFDDGPSQWTEPILDLLADAKAKATFFVCGWAIEGNEDIIRRIHRDGHEIGNHTFSHPRLVALTDTKVRKELLQTSAAIEGLTDTRPWVWRAPHFAHDERVDKIARSLGMEHVGCDVDPVDWLRDCDEIVSDVLRARGDGEIIDLHDGIPPGGGSGSSNRWATVNAVRRLLELMDTPYVTISDLELAA